MKKYVSVLAAALVILMSGCAANDAALSGSGGTSTGNAAVNDISSAAVDSGSPEGEESSAPASEGSSGTSGTSAPSTTPGSTAGTSGGVSEAVSVPPDTGAVTTPGTPSSSKTEEKSTAGTVKGDTEPSASAPSTVAPTGDLSPEEPSKGVLDHGYIAEDIMADADIAFDYADIPVSAGAPDTGGGMDDAMYEAAADGCMPAPGYFYEEPVIPQAGLLTGGEWRDNDHWSDWNELYSSRNDWSRYKENWRIAFDNRIAVKVTADGAPLGGARVSCGETSAVTDNKGMAYLFYAALNGPTPSVEVSYGGVTEELEGVIGDAELTCELSGVTAPEGKSLDLMIMCDTTGSMSDELVYLQEELRDIVRRIQRENSNIPARLSVNFYRDEGDEYVIREYPFTSDISSAVADMSSQEAAGGGDYPEAVHTALDSAINKHDWNEDSVKIMFLVLDAPPHNDVQIIDSVNSCITRAAEQGIRIIPIASSGVDKSTEYLLRCMAFATGGTYTFLTDDSGVGGEHIEATVGAYNVEKLNDMMVRIVNGYLQ